MASTLTQRLFQLEPQYRERVWGGRRLKAADPPVGEAWVAFAESRVQEGAHAGRTVGELAEECGERFLGRQVAETYGARFPLLVKLLDCADWLSVQVHPNDEQAARLVGHGACGKSEAWHFLEADAGASFYAGVHPGTTRADLERAIREGRVLDVARRFEAHAGETVFIPAGTLHSLGPGLLLYEVQQASDTTFRVYDWDRPAAAGRALHVEQSVAVADPHKEAVVSPPPKLRGTSSVTVVSCPFFELDVVRVDDSDFEDDTEGRAFHLLTVIEGSLKLSCDEETMPLARHQTALVAGGAGAYRIHADGGKSEVLRATLPPPTTSECEL